MNRVSTLAIIAILLHNNTIHPNIETMPVKSSPDSVQTKKSRKDSIAVLSTLGSIPTLFYYLTNVKALGGSIVVILGILKYMWNSKASLEDQHKIQEQVNGLEKEIVDIKTNTSNINNGITSLQTNIDELQKLLSELGTSMDNLHNKSTNLEVICTKQNEKNIQLENKSEKITLILQEISSEITISKDNLQKANNAIEGSSKDIQALKQFDSDHQKITQELSNHVQKNTEKIEEFNISQTKNYENYLEGIGKINTETKELNGKLGILLEHKESLNQKVDNHFEDIKRVVISLETRLTLLEKNSNLDQN